MSTLEAVFSWVLTTTWQASVLAVLVLAVQTTLGSRLNPRWRYALWLLVLLRLVLPDVPESALSLFRYAPAAPLNLPETILQPSEVTQVTVSNPPFPPIQHEALTPHLNFTFLYLAILWLSGACGLLLLTFLVNFRFARQVAYSPEITDPALRKIFADARADLRVRRRIRLIESSHVSSPAIMGLFTPTLLLPSGAKEKFTPRELRFIFLHELAHLKRGDVLVQALIAFLQIVHWFNPVLWYAFRRLRADREPATDALVLSRTGEADKEPYGLMLLKLLEHFNQRHALPTLVGILEDKGQFKRRFTLIARFTRGAYGWSLLGVVLMAVLAVACLTKSKAMDSAASPSLAIAASRPAQAASQPEIEIDFTVIQIAESTYQQQAAGIDQAVKNGNIAFLSRLQGASILSSPLLTTQTDQRCEISIGKELITGDKSTPNTTYTATSILGANGKVVPTVVKSETPGPFKSFLGVDFKITPSISNDGAILLSTRYEVGYIPDYKSPTDFGTRTCVTDQRLSLADGQSTGFFAGYENAASGNRFNYSLLAILNSPGDQIKTLPPLSPSPNRLALIVTARRVAPVQASQNSANAPTPDSR